MSRNYLTKRETKLLSNTLSENYLVDLNFYGNCGAQLFSVNKITNEVQECITEFFKAHNIKIGFSENGLGFFTIRRDQHNKTTP